MGTQTVGDLINKYIADFDQLTEDKLLQAKARTTYKSVVKDQVYNMEVKREGSSITLTIRRRYNKGYNDEPMIISASEMVTNFLPLQIIDKPKNNTFTYVAIGALSVATLVLMFKLFVHKKSA